MTITRTTGTGPTIPPAGIIPQGPPVESPPVTAPATDPPTPEGGTTVDNQTRQYETGKGNPTDVAFPERPQLNPLQQAQIRNVEALFQNPSQMPSLQRQAMDTLAKSLGFRDLTALQHHLRRFENQQVQVGNQTMSLKQLLLSQLSQKLAGSQDMHQATREAFEQTFKQGIASIFERPELKGTPQPQFFTQTRSGSDWQTTTASNAWDTASLAAVYNGLESIYEQSPQRLVEMARGAGSENGQQKPLNFIRRDQPEVGNRDDYLKVLSDATRIAHADTSNGQIYLYDTAVKGDQNNITGLVVDKLDLISRFQTREGEKPELAPTYTDAEMDARGLKQAEGERQVPYRNRLRETLKGEYVERFGGWQNLQRAMNFVTRYRNLPVEQVPENGQPNDPRTLAALEKMGSSLPEVMARMEQIDAVMKMQQFLKDNAPPGSSMANLNVDGYIGKETQLMTRSFQAGMALNAFKERIEDDPQLPENRKRELVQVINEKFRELAGDPAKAQTVFQQVRQRIQNLLTETPTQLAEHTRTGLRSDIQQTTNIFRTGAFDRQTAEYLVNGWLNVMDSGKGGDLAEQLVVHELGHVWEQVLQQEGLQVSENWARLFENPQATDDFSTSQMNTHDYSDHLHDDRAAASDYGSVNATEDFAETTRMFTYDPQRLMRRSLMKFLFVNALNPDASKRFSNADIMRMATECGYTQEEVKQRLDAVMGHGTSDIRFTQPMMVRLNDVYGSLRTELSQPPVQVHFAEDSPESTEPAPAPAPHDENGEPETVEVAPVETTGASAAPPPAPNESGYAFKAFSDRLKTLQTELQQAQGNASRSDMIRTQIKGLIEGFVARGPASLPDMPPEAVTALNNALLGHMFGRDGQPSQQGYALIAAMAIYQTTGQFSRAQYPELAQHLPASFDQLVSNSSFRNVMGPQADPAFSVTQRLVSSLEQMRWLEGKSDSAASALEEVPLYVEDLFKDLQQELGSALSNPNLSSAERNRLVNSYLARPEVQAIFANHQDFLEMGLTGMNSALRSLRPMLGMPVPDFSPRAFQRYLLLAVASGKTSGSDFATFALNQFQLDAAQGNRLHSGQHG